MRRRYALWLLAAVLLVTVPVLAACATGGEKTLTETVTITGTPPTETVKLPPITITRTPPAGTLVMPPGGTLTAADAPLTPHSLNVGYGICGACHLINTTHVGRELMQNICGECHREGPQILFGE